MGDSALREEMKLAVAKALKAYYTGLKRVLVSALVTCFCRPCTQNKFLLILYVRCIGVAICPYESVQEILALTHKHK